MTVTLLYFNQTSGMEESMILKSECNIPLITLKGIDQKDLKHLPAKTVDELISCREEFLKNKSLSIKIINFINSIQKKFIISEKNVKVKITDPHISSKVISQIMSEFLEKNKTVTSTVSKKNNWQSFTPRKHRSYSIKALR